MINAIMVKQFSCGKNGHKLNNIESFLLAIRISTYERITWITCTANPKTLACCGEITCRDCLETQMYILCNLSAHKK